MSKSLPYSMKDVGYDNAKFRHRSFSKVLNQTVFTNKVKHECFKCSTGKFLVIVLLIGLGYVMLTPAEHTDATYGVDNNATKGIGNATWNANSRLKRIFRRAPRLPPRLTPDEMLNSSNSIRPVDIEALKWVDKQQKVREAFIHAWSGYKKFAMGFDELMPISKRGIDGLGGLGATVVDALDTAMIMGIEDIVSEAGTWIETHLAERINNKGQINLFETTIRVLGGLLSAYHLSSGASSASTQTGPRPNVYLENARLLADRLLSAFTSSPTAIPFSDVVLHDSSAHPAPGGLSSTSEVSTLQLEFNYLTEVTGDLKYSLEAMKVLEHMKTLPKVEGLVPIYISPHTGEFSGQNIRLGSRGDSYYEYLLKVWLQQGAFKNSNLTYLHNMYEEAMKGVKHLLVRKSIPSGLIFVGELPYGASGEFSPKMDHLFDIKKRVKTWVQRENTLMLIVETIV
ncbi:hypothetical protein Cgig2_024190 [Carnegiea gigantea]|uniref:alpha-1,2-Mannosidase n=1 Tax=Carnegiea gigantea TaxID=171969 RepID=A0A9Q1QI43_9CARY|nr:hypothetical protein Cgig2_024190 [Carnegiea gigantea]